jgi:hypothetical protein
MGMFDWFKPIPDLRCPNCKTILSEWQGYPPGCALFIWEQDIAYPIAQVASEECKISDEERRKIRLPDEFDIYTFCENCPDYRITTECKTEDGIWSKIESIKVEKIPKLPKKWFNQK